MWLQVYIKVYLRLTELSTKRIIISQSVFKYSLSDAISGRWGSNQKVTVPHG
jgi:hypothetical protein